MQQLTLPWITSALFATPAVTKPAARSQAQRHVALCGQHIAYELKRSRRRTIGFLINDAGLKVTAPTWVTLTQIEQALQAKQAWIVRKLTEWHNRAQTTNSPMTRWEDGGFVLYRGTPLTLVVQSGPPAVHEQETHLIVCLRPNSSQDALRITLQTWLQDRARELFAERLPVYAARLGQHPTRWTLSNARTRWGSCAADGSIRLNWRLVQLPLPLIDYVIAHELAHLREMNHGPRFWSTVMQLMPDFETARRMLRQYPSGAC